jgi:serine/threonine protein kinase
MPSLSRHRSNFKWGQWEQIRPLRKEAYGKVCLARRGSETAVVKVAYRRWEGKFARNPRAESAILKRLGQNPHAHIVQWLAEYEDDQEFCMVLELCRGGNLFDWVESSHKPGVSRFFFQQVVKGVAHIHSQGLAHLNLGLENLLLDKDCVKVANFVFARATHIPLTATVESLPGHKQYMAPEVFRTVNPFDGQKADIWSLGVVLFALLTGILPFQLPCTSDPAFCAIIQGRGIAALNLSPSAAVLLTQLLSADPASRPTAEEILNAEWLQAETS